jgi:hypothetical protein
MVPVNYSEPPHALTVREGPCAQEYIIGRYKRKRVALVVGKGEEVGGRGAIGEG